MSSSPAFDAEAATAAVMAAMRPLADAERAGQAKRYLKSDLGFLGVSVPAIRSAVTGTARSGPVPGREGVRAVRHPDAGREGVLPPEAIQLKASYQRTRFGEVSV